MSEVHLFNVAVNILIYGENAVDIIFCHSKETLHITNKFPNSCRKTETLAKCAQQGFLIISKGTFLFSYSKISRDFLQFSHCHHMYISVVYFFNKYIAKKPN